MHLYEYMPLLYEYAMCLYEYPICRVRVHGMSSTAAAAGISGEKIEIDPKQSKGMLFRHKAMTCDIDDVANCELLSVKEKSGQSCDVV